MTSEMDTKLNKAVIVSPLRYPGGKSRAVGRILPIIREHTEYREPFLGGGSVFVRSKQEFPHREYWINDLNEDLYLFWKYVKHDVSGLADGIRRIKDRYNDGREVFELYRNNWRGGDDLERAVRYFILNRITFSGITECGGYSQYAFERRFTDSSIDRVLRLGEIMGGVNITNRDYREVVLYPGENVFIFLDPPYYSSSRSRLYGRNGNLHTSFDHEGLASVMKKCEHAWLMTCDDCGEMRELFSFANIIPWSLQYGMNNYRQPVAAPGKELFVANFDILTA